MNMKTKADHRAVIAHVAGRLEQVAPEEAALLRQLHACMFNRVPEVRARHTSQRMTPEVKRRIHLINQQDPTLPQHEIGKLVGVNQGRVNETLLGK